VPFSEGNIGASGGSDSHNLNGTIGGLQAGYNWQMANYLAGLEADIQISDQKGSSSSTDLFPTTVPPVDGIAAITHTERLLWFGTVRGRVGAIFDRWLVYGTGGLAYGALKTDGTAIATGSPGCSPVVGCPFQPLANWTNTSINLGWTIGAGIEGAVNNYWTLKVEYLYVDLGNLDTNFATTSGLFGNFNTGNGGLIRVVAGNGTIHSNVTDNIVRVGLNYQFH
jgi:outer membrane immunogenic protein